MRCVRQQSDSGRYSCTIGNPNVNVRFLVSFLLSLLLLVVFSFIRESLLPLKTVQSAKMNWQLSKDKI